MLEIVLKRLYMPWHPEDSIEQKNLYHIITRSYEMCRCDKFPDMLDM